jgi:hypothetical protein
VRGRLLATFSSWQLQSAPSAQRADSAHADTRRETRMDGEVLVRVNDEAEIASLDLALNLGASWDDGKGPVAGGARLTWPGAPLAALDAFYEPGRLGSRTGEFDAVEALGYGPAEVYVRGLDEVARQVRAARDVWRGGRCVEVVVERGPETNDILPGTEVEIGPRAKSRVDGAFVEPARLLARAEGAAVSPLVPVPYPATFGFTMPDGPVSVELRADTRRGVGRKRLLFVRQHNAGSISYAAVASYVVDVTNRGERLYGTVTDSMSVESAIELRAGSFIPGELAVHSRNTIFVGGRARMTTASEASEEVHTLSLAGTGETTNPAPELELMRFSFPTHAPVWGPEPRPGTIAFSRRGGRSLYSLSLGVWQFAPTLEWERRAVFSCPQNAVGRSLEVYENVKHTSVTTVEVPQGCTTNRRSKRVELPGPYTFGAIAADRSAPDSVTGSRALISGQYDPDAPSDYITGEETRTLTSCLAVRASDPTGLAQLTLPPFVPVDASGSIPGVRCRLHYRLRWKIPRRPAGG